MPRGLLPQVFNVVRLVTESYKPQVLKGVQYIHNTLGISHGSLSEDNVHITEDGEVKIGEELPSVRSSTSLTEP